MPVSHIHTHTHTHTHTGLYSKESLLSLFRKGKDHEAP
jgi:hypothetical protein